MFKVKILTKVATSLVFFVFLSSAPSKAGIVIDVNGPNKMGGCLCIGSVKFCSGQCGGSIASPDIPLFRGDVVVAMPGKRFEVAGLSVSTEDGETGTLSFVPTAAASTPVRGDISTRRALARETAQLDDVVISSPQTGESIRLSTIVSLLSTLEDRGRGVWTEWLNRDAPGGSGDYETLSDFVKEGKACSSPKAIECQTRDGKSWQAARQVYTCSPELGGVCRNADQLSGKPCLDYRVRFLCQE